MAPILTRLVQITLFKNHTEQWLFCMCFILEKQYQIWQTGLQLEKSENSENHYFFIKMNIATCQQLLLRCGNRATPPGLPFLLTSWEQWETLQRVTEQDPTMHLSWRVSFCFASKLIYKIITNANKLVIWVSCWNLEVPNYLSVSRSLKITHVHNSLSAFTTWIRIMTWLTTHTLKNSLEKS